MIPNEYGGSVRLEPRPLKQLRQAKPTYLFGFELKSVGWYEMWFSSYLATFGRVSSAFKMGNVLLKNSRVLVLMTSLEKRKRLVSILFG